MRVRTTLLGVLTGALATTALWVGTAPAHAAYTADPDDTTFTPVEADLVGVGSDTIQHTLKLLADAWNSQSPAPTFKVATYAATGGGTIPAIGDVTRPNGSGSGKAQLWNPSNPAVDFARASSSLSTGASSETSAGLQQIPFALDTLRMAVSNSTPSHAPASLTGAQILSIYKGEVTNWSQLGGQNGAIVPAIPQAGSGTRSFFESQLKALNGGNAVTYPATLLTVQEHDDALIKNNADVVAPFSVGRAGLLGGTVKLLAGTANGGWDAKRALYDVVRQADVSSPSVQAFFGSDGFVCSDGAQALIEASGFEQLARPADGGVCGVQTQVATSNFTLNGAHDPVSTSTTVAGKSTAAGRVTLTATVASTPVADGTVTFFEGDNAVQSNIPVVGGVATATLSGQTPGAHTYTAEFSPTIGTLYQPSSASAVDVTVRTSATIAETFPSKVAKGARAKGTVTVTLADVDATATGKVTVKRGAKTVGSGTLKGGKVTITLDALPAGKNSLVVKWAGDKNGVAAKKSFTITQK